MVCIFEGLPGAGKTTILNSMAKYFEPQNIIILPEYLPGITGDRSGISFYVNNEEKKSKQMEKAKGKYCFCDRYWQSSAVYCSASSNAICVEELMSIYRILHKKELFSSYVYVYLRVTVEESLRRAQKPDVGNMWSTPSFCRRALELYDMLFSFMDEINPNLQGKLLVDMEATNGEDAGLYIADYLKSFAHG